jgi:hypothetical protein
LYLGRLDSLRLRLERFRALDLSNRDMPRRVFVAVLLHRDAGGGLNGRSLYIQWYKACTSFVRMRDGRFDVGSL